MMTIVIRQSSSSIVTYRCCLPETREYCDWETFNGTCTTTDRIIIIENARYGRMHVGRCVSKSYGHIGCGTDVTSDFERACSGRQTCSISVISLHEKRSCPRDFTSFLEVAYVCQKGITCPKIDKQLL